VMSVQLAVCSGCCHQRLLESAQKAVLRHYQAGEIPSLFPELDIQLG
jgi:hypothetical protein